jgi:hypothetical protein
MAVASTGNDFSKLSETKEPLFGSANGGKEDKRQLNFYESIYNFKKMFPNLDYEVIETVLRSNNGNIDKSIDQLLTMSIDTEVIEAAADTRSVQSPTVQTGNLSAGSGRQTSQNLSDSTDQPPSYSELVSMNLIENNKSSPSPATNASDKKNGSSSVKKLDEKPSAQHSYRKSELISDSTSQISKKQTNLSSTTPLTFKHSTKYINNFNKILIGDLSRDFLRIKLKNEQVKKLKSSIKKAKRNEIVAILNNVCFF